MDAERTPRRPDSAPDGVDPDKNGRILLQDRIEMLRNMERKSGLEAVLKEKATQLALKKRHEILDEVGNHIRQQGALFRDYVKALATNDDVKDQIAQTQNIFQNEHGALQSSHEALKAENQDLRAQINNLQHLVNQVLASAAKPPTPAI